MMMSIDNKTPNGSILRQFWIARGSVVQIGANMVGLMRRDEFALSDNLCIWFNQLLSSYIINTAQIMLPEVIIFVFELSLTYYSHYYWLAWKGLVIVDGSMY